jgi:hypothetical protein
MAKLNPNWRNPNRGDQFAEPYVARCVRRFEAGKMSKEYVREMIREGHFTLNEFINEQAKRYTRR